MCDGTKKNFQRLPTLLFVLLGLCFAYFACGCVSARYAFAEDGSGGGSFDYAVVYGPNSVAGLSDMDDPRYLVQVYAPNNFDAALLALGYNPTSSSFTDDARAYLSNQSTGGAFYDFAQLFTNNNTDWGEEITTNPSLTPGINFDVSNMETALRLNNSIYGADNVWSAEYTTSQRIAAVTAVGLVLSGSIGGGGGSGGIVSGDYTLIPVQDWQPHEHTGVLDVDYAAIPTEKFQELTQYAQSNGQDILVRVGKDMGGTGYGRVMFMTVPKNAVEFLATNESNNRTYVCKWVTAFQSKRVNSTYRISEILIIDGKKCAPATSAVANYSFPANTYDGWYPIAAYSWADDTTTVVPPTNWPDPPESPTVDPPSVPQPPTDDPIEQPTDTPIQPPNVWMPIAGTTDPTFTVDLQGVLDAMATHCQHIRDNLDANFSQLYNNMTDYWSRKYTNFKQFLDGQFGYIGDTIVDETKELMEYLEDLFEWLAEQFDFSVSGTGYNDNTVVSWLRRIYARLGGGTTIRPPDPVVDPKGTGDWLNQLLQNLVLDLLALGQDVLADLVESFRELITKFPFSIPWDIAAILALLVAEPQAPVLEVPQYTYTGIAIQQVGTYRIDLSEWNSVMDVVRPMETILFAGWLAFKTDFFKGLLEMTKG